MAESFTIVGSSVASLTAALLAAQRGHRVNLYVDPLRIGGSFGGLKVGNRRLDLGCRLFELDYENTPAKPIERFDPINDSHRHFIVEVAGFIEQVLQDDIRPAYVPEMLIAGCRTRCVLMTADLSDLPAALSQEDRKQVRAEVEKILQLPAMQNTSYKTLREVSLAQHGPRLHELLIQAVCAKQHPGWDAVLASDRRKLWAALFQPRTVLEAFSGGPIGFQPYRPFSTTRAGSLFPFVDRLYHSVCENDQITVIPAGPLSRLSCGGSGLAEFGFNKTSISVPSEQCVVAESPEQVFKAAGRAYKPERMISSMIWVDVADGDIDRDLSTLTICDPDLPVLRISNVGITARRRCFSVEFGHLPPCPKIAVAALRQAGVVRTGATVEIVHQVTGRAQIVPTPASRRHFEDAQTCLAAFKGMLLGGLRRFLFDGLNDQITDAMFFGATRC